MKRAPLCFARHLACLAIGSGILLTGTLPAVNVNPGATQALSGTTSAANPDLAQVNSGGIAFNFEVRDGSDNLVIEGIITDSVGVSNNLGTRIFDFGIRNLSGPAGAEVVGVDWNGFRGVTTDTDWRIDGLGDVGPNSVTRSGDGNRLAYRYDPNVIDPPDDSRFVGVLTNSPDFDRNGSFTIYARASAAAPVFSTVIEGVAAPGALEVTSGQSIQWAIDNASPGDTVTVAPGNYNEDLTLRSGIDVEGAGEDSTTLTGSGTGSVVTANSVDNAEFTGFTVQGSGGGPLDAGFQIINSDIVVRNNTITGNTVGISTSGSNSFICSNLITENGIPGGAFDHAIYCRGSDLFAGNLIVNNDAGPLAIDSNGSQFLNNTIADNNWWGFQADGITTNTTVKNNIFSQNGAGGIFADDDSVVESTYNCLFETSPAYAEVRGGSVTSRLGDLLADPEFDLAQPGAYLLSTASPCIDAGDPAEFYNDLDGSRNDMGATGGLCGSETPPGSILSGFVWTSVGSYANLTGIAQSGLKRGLTTDRDRPFGGRPWLFGAFGTTESAVTRYAVKVGKWTGGTPPAPGDFEYRSDPLSKTRFNISSGSLVAETIGLGPTLSGGRPTYQLTRNSGNIFWAHENLRLLLDTNSLENGTYSVRIEALNFFGGDIPLEVNEDIIIRVNNTRPVARIDAVSLVTGPPFDECSVIDLPAATTPLKFKYTARHDDGFLDNYDLVALVGRNRSGGTIVSGSYTPGPDPIWTGVDMIDLTATPGTTGTLLPWETCAYQFRLRAWARTTNGFNRIYRNDFFDNYAIDLEDSVICTPDLDGDGDVDAADLAIMAAAYGSAP